MASSVRSFIVELTRLLTTHAEHDEAAWSLDYHCQPLARQEKK